MFVFDVGGVSGGLNTGSNASAIAKSNYDLDREGFMMLLIAELRHQDPLEPLKNHEYITQLTQFTSLDELRNIRTLLEQLQYSEQTNLNAQSIGMIGKEVTVKDHTIEHKVGLKTTLSFQLPSDEEVKILVYNSQGQLVREDRYVGSRISGWNSYEFDGRNSDGNLLPDGVYHVQVVTPPDSQGLVAVYSVFQTGRVTGVDFTGTTPFLELENGQRAPLSSVAGIREVNS